MSTDRHAAANRRTLVKLLSVAVFMFGFGYALVPLYEVICEITGISFKDGGRTQASFEVDRSRWVTVEFNSAVMSGLPWEFRPLTRKLRVHPGQLTTVKYLAHNLADQPVTGQATPRISPPRATRYFKKTECFCFSNQRLNPGEEREMAVTFLVDPSLPKTVDAVTLFYSFYNLNAHARSDSTTGGSG
ncbi:MAG: cytochrome c oxidase assembly protein [Gammaproteobacteria bacterium]|nr:cytochrome c oxidase assembly protein [Gammaproteobacteria bacterium]